MPLYLPPTTISMKLYDVMQNKVKRGTVAEWSLLYIEYKETFVREQQMAKGKRTRELVYKTKLKVKGGQNKLKERKIPRGMKEKVIKIFISGP